MVESLVNSLLFKPPRVRVHEFRLIHLNTSHREQICATFLAKRGANLTILYSHGNAEDLNTCYHWMRRLSRELNANVIGYDYSGYGLSTGTPSEHNCYADIEAIFDYLIENRGLSPHQVVLYGRSLGSGPSCWLAHKTAREGRSVGGLILHSPFTSVYRVVVNLGFTMVGDKFPNIDRIKEVVCPVVIVHGKDDTIVPIDHGMKLQDAVSERFQTKPLWMENTGHNDHGPVMEEALIGHLNSFLDYHILARRLWMNPPQQQRLASAQKRKNRLSSPTRLKRRHLLANRREV